MPADTNHVATAVGDGSAFDLGHVSEDLAEGPRRDELTTARIVIVDDEPANIALLVRLLRIAGFTNVSTTTDSTDAADLCARVAPDIILLDLNMPVMDGYEVLEEIGRTMGKEDFLPVLVLTGDVSREAKQRALVAGAKDFLTKPFDLEEVVLRIANLLETRWLHLQLKRQNENLEQIVQQRTDELWAAVTRLESSEQEVRRSQEETVRRLATAAEFRDDGTHRHLLRMSRYCEILASASGIASDRCEVLRVASQMHDIGKIGIPDSILLKPGPLTPHERLQMEQHTTIGYRILKDSGADLVRLAASIALTHHERYDGTGYPRGLAGGDIPLEGRIAAVADVFDALTTDRVYRAALPLDLAHHTMLQARGAHFDPDLLDVFFDSLDYVTEVMRGWGESLP